jgi:GR25 family glycosyltransferase involved in LPS biosynthesis
MEEYKKYKLSSVGVDVKLLSFEENAINRIENIIDLHKCMETTIFNKKLNTNCILINIESDKFRYNSSVNELKKISFKNFVHLKATYWKDRDNFITDLNYVMNFLREFNPDIPVDGFTINNFSEINDPNIYITDGPLACYVSHLRAMIYGYLNFEDYCIIMEDDATITNTENIKKYLKDIPNDWHIIKMNSSPKNVKYDSNCYKFVDEFHSSHFYILKIACLETIFKNVYPVIDQIDVLISKLFSTLNIYNITDTVYQRNLSTNTQNNLYVIFNSPYYDVVRYHLNRIENKLENYINKELVDNQLNNKKIKDILVYDFIYSVIMRDANEGGNPDKISENDIVSEIDDEILCDLSFVFECTKKGVNTDNISKILLNYINKYN